MRNKCVNHILKILYAASNNENAKIQLSRFIRAMENTSVQIKVAAYKKSSPINLNVDWTLDCLLNVFKPDLLSLDNENLNIYLEQVKYYNPDLIISDMEFFTSHIANLLDITLWQCSSSLLNFAATNKYDIGLFKSYAYLLAKNNSQRVRQQNNIINNSNCNFIYSHLGDTTNPPALKNNFEWIRPYHTIGKKSIPCQHNIVTGMLGNNKKILALVKKQQDSVVFTESCLEQHAGAWLKDIGNQEEYFCNLKNSNLFVCEGQTSFLADAFYNGKYSVVMTNFKDIECISNSMFSEHLGLSSCIYSTTVDLSLFLNREITIQKNEKIQFLHEKIDELI